MTTITLTTGTISYSSRMRPEAVGPGDSGPDRTAPIRWAGMFVGDDEFARRNSHLKVASAAHDQDGCDGFLVGPFLVADVYQPSLYQRFHRLAFDI